MSDRGQFERRRAVLIRSRTILATRRRALRLLAIEANGMANSRSKRVAVLGVEQQNEGVEETATVLDQQCRMYNTLAIEHDETRLYDPEAVR